MKQHSLLLGLCFFGLLSISYSQSTTIDSLKLLIEKSRPDTQRVRWLNELSEEFRSDDNKLAEPFILEAESLAIRLRDTIGWARALNNKGIWQQKNGQSKKAEATYREGLLISKNKDNKVVTADLYGNLGLTNYYQGQLDTAIYYTLKAININNELGKMANVARFYNNIGIYYRKKGDMDNAISFTRQSLALKKIYGKPNAIAASYGSLANLHFSLTNYDSATYYLQECMTIAKKESNETMLARAMNVLARVYREQGLFEKELDLRFDALRLRIEKGDSIGMAKSYHDIGNTYTVLKNKGKALEYIQKSFELDKRFNLAGGFANSYNLIGLLYNDEGKRDSALFYYRKALSSINLTANVEAEASILYNITSMHLQLKQLDSARIYNQRLLELAERTNLSVMLNLAKESMGVIYLEEENFEGAIPLYREVIKEHRAKGNREDLLSALKGMGQAQAGAGDWKEAYYYVNDYRLLKDSIVKDELAKQTAEAEARFQLERKQNEINQQELDIQREVNLRNKIIGIATGILLLVIAIAQYLRYRQRLKRKQAELEMEVQQKKAAELRKLDQMKSNFFANISHEFRTPLTLILSPIEQMLEGSLKGNPKNWLRIMKQNGNRLLTLVNQLLDLSRLESGKMVFQTQTENATEIFKAMVYSFESLAESRQIDYQIELPEQGLLAELDREKIEKVLINLLSNAFKFTEEGGAVRASMKGVGERLYFEISDTGLGISKQDLPHVFERFFQTEGSNEFGTGSGIGLALTKELVELHQGTIEVESEEDKGTTFRVSMPIGAPDLSSSQFSENTVSGSTETTSAKKMIPSATALSLPNGQPQLLIVEDNADLRHYIREQLKEHFNIVEARDGEEGLQKTIEAVPDLVISDIMMPRMNGIELCKQLKTNEKTSHIPVVLLTAKADRDDKIEGLETGADAYVTKPFDAKELQIRVQKLIENREQLRKKFSSDFSFKPSEVSASSIDLTFLQNVKEVIENHIGDELFGVPELSREVGFSRSQLHRKLTALTNKSPSQLIREIRLYRAKELLEKRAGNASEIAYMCGYSSPAQFSKSFKKFFKISPSEVETLV